MFQAAYLVLQRANVLSIKISLETAITLTFIVGVIYSMLISETGLKGWTHSPLLDFQNERLLVYFMSFLLGSLCNKLNVFESNKPNYKIYILSNVTLTIFLTIFTFVALNLFYNLIEPGRNYFFISEFADRVIYYSSAILSMLCFLQILLHVFRFNLNKTNPVFSELGRNSYSVYIIHMIVLGIIALAMMQLPIHGGIKYVLLSVFTFLLTNMIIYSWRQAKQKSINAKTVITAMLVVFIIGTAFHGTEKSPQKNQEQTTQVQQPVSLTKMSLHAAVITGNLEMVKYHIKSGTNLNEKEAAGGSSPLTVATLFGQTETALALIEAGADINQTNNDGSTALHTAAFFCRTEIIKALLTHGVDKTIKNKVGSTAAESVTAPFEVVQPIYDYFSKIYEPLGLKLDYERIKSTRPKIVEMLK
jgi:peptidoglycan/LPS O-acetylase OafA/YrhL